jgi:uncharacterized protein (TIGR02594 family)
MRPVTLCSALILSFVLLAPNATLNASPIDRLADQTVVAPTQPAKKPAVAKQSVSKPAAMRQALKRHVAAKQRPRMVVAVKPNKFVAAANQSQKVVARPAKKIAAAPQRPKVATQAKRRVARTAYASVSAVPVTQYRNRADISSESSFQYALQPRVKPRVRQATQTTTARKMSVLFASSDIVSEARRWIGTNPTNMSRVWCARFMNFVLERVGYSGTGSDAANSFASYGRRVPGPQVGAIAVMTRGRNGGHVGVVSGIDPSGNPIVISGNHGHRVGEGVYSRSRIYAYVRPM